VSSPARDIRVAALAALVASLGDLLLLYVANSQRPELGLPQVGRAWLWLGASLGVVALPIYAIGYRCASRLVAAASERAARTLFVSGTAGALIGAAIHGLTAAYIDRDLDAAAAGRDPLTSMLDWGPALLSLWALAGLLVLAASALFAWFVGGGRTRAPRCAALANPALLTIALSTAGLPFVLLRAFLTPAAPNLAHLIFFVVCARISRPERPRESVRPPLRGR
jgi:hypothetical protein